MASWPRYAWLPLWLLFLLGALYSRPPMPIDETRYLSVAWEMWHSHQFLVPHVNGMPYSHKPPLLFWCIQAGWSILGVNAWSARMTAPLCALLSILLTIRLGHKLWPDQGELGRILPYLFLGNCFWALYGTLTMFDTLVGCFALVAWLALRAGHVGQLVRCWSLFALATGLGILAKGPVILVYIVPPALLAPWWSEKGRIRSCKLWYGGLLAALSGGALLALCWAVPAARAGGKVYTQAILFGQTAGRMVHSFAHPHPFYWYILFFPLLLFPWLFVLPRRRKIRWIRLDAQGRFCLSILLPAFVLFSLISGKQVHYLLPLLPPLFLLLGQFFCAQDEEGWSGRLPLVPILLLLLGLGLLIVPYIPLPDGDSAMLRFLPRWLGIVPVLAALLLWLPRPGVSSPQIIVRNGIVLTVMLLCLHLGLKNPLHALYDLRPIGMAMHAVQRKKKLIAVYPARLVDQFQFAGRLRTSLVPLASLEGAVRWSARFPHAFVLLRLNARRYPFFARGALVHPLARKWLVFRPGIGLGADYKRMVGAGK